MPAQLTSFAWPKPTISRLFKIGVAFVVAGSLSGTAVVAWAIASGAVTVGGPQLVAIDRGTVAGAALGLALASLLAVAGTAAAFASWVGALLNTARLQDKAWFVALLVLGLLSLGWPAMVAYLVAGPDSSTEQVDSRLASLPKSATAPFTQGRI